MTNFIIKNKRSIIRFAFLIPIILVVIISISHVISWYSLANPISWAIYLSIAVEIAAMSAVAAATVRIKGISVWIVFAIVTLIQFIGNIFYCYSQIDVTSIGFKNWVELTAPVFEAIGSDLSDVIAQKRWLALLEGGLLPIISLTSLHFFIKYDNIDLEKPIDNIEPEVPLNEEKIVEAFESISEEPIIEEPKEHIIKNAEPEEPASVINIISEPIKEIPTKIKENIQLNKQEVPLKKKN